jgi:hypothetical protein
MNHLFTKSLAVAALTLGALAATTSAQAGSDVQVSIGVQVPGVYLHAAPVYAHPQPIYLPAPNHHRNFDEGRRYDEPRGDRFNNHGREDYPRAYPLHNTWQTQLYGPNGDLDRDGVVNRRDHHPNNPYRR